MSQHLTLSQRKALSPRLALFEVIRQSVLEPSQREAAQFVENELVRKSNFALDAEGEGPSEPLDAYLKHNLLPRLKSAVESEFQGGDEEETRLAYVLPVLAEFDERVAGIDCERCSDGSRICQGGPHDNRIVEEGGVCIGEIKGMFALAVHLSDSAYGMANVGGRAELGLSTWKLTKKPFGFSDVAASGSCERNGKGRNINLYFHIEKFDYKSYNSIPYILMHECFIHGYEGCERVAESMDMFSEGWMDLVALEVMSGRCLPLKHSPVAGLPESSVEHIMHGRELHQLRTASSKHYTYGVGIARYVWDLMRRLDQEEGWPPGLSADTHFVRLSCGINRLPLGARDRTMMMSAFGSFFRSQRLNVPGAEASLVSALRGFMSRRIGAKEVVEAVLETKRPKH